MSLIGTLEQFSLSSILVRVEAHTKTGLCVIKQGVQWVELYFREGRLMCVGPVRTNATLGERLLQAGVITPQALQEALLVIGTAQPGETRMALTLMDLGHVGHEALRAWATQKAQEVLQVLMTWPTGEIYFEEEVAPPADRLLVALSISSLLSSVSVSAVPPKPHYEHAYSGAVSSIAQEQSKEGMSTPHIADAPTLFIASRFSPETASPRPSFSSTESSLPVSVGGIPNSVRPASPPSQASQPMSVMMPVTPKRIDTSIMHPELVLLPADLAAFREKNVQVQLTPDQWRLMTRIDGQTTLQMASQALGMTRGIICQVAGELLAEGLVCVAQPTFTQMNELSPVSREFIFSGLSNGYIAPGYEATTPSPWAAATPMSDVLSQFSPQNFETQSQWGNGESRASFVPGRGWVATPQPLQPLQPSGPMVSYGGAYESVGGRR